MLKKRPNRTPSAAKIEIVDAHAEARRLDNFVMSQVRIPRTLLYRLIRTGQVRVNGRRARPQQRLQIGDRVRIPPLRAAERRRRSTPRRVQTRIEAAIVLESDDFIVVDKPAGLAVHSGSGLNYGLVDVIRQLRPAVTRVDLVHRLDRDTSGCVLLAKNTEALRALNASLASGGFTKRYFALLAGRLHAKDISVTAPLAAWRGDDGEKRIQSAPHGRTAHTRYESLETRAGTSFCRVTIETGRTHQIRAHAQALQHPIVGDQRYGDPDVNARFKALGLGRLFLHASVLEFSLRGQRYRATARLPADLAAVLTRLRQTSPG